MIAKVIEKPSAIFNAETLFKQFAANGQSLTFDEFSNIFKKLKLQICHVEMLRIFSEADIDKNGELSYQDFIRAFQIMKNHFVQKYLIENGITYQDMIISLIGAIIMLLLMFAFIFVGISAFSPTSPFSSVINSLMPLLAGFSVNRQEMKSGDAKKEEIKDAAKETKM